MSCPVQSRQHKALAQQPPTGRTLRKVQLQKRNDDSARAIQLYAAGIADAIIEGRSSVHDSVSEDDFVEVEQEAPAAPEETEASNDDAAES